MPVNRSSGFLALGCVGFISSVASVPAAGQSEPRSDEPARLEGVTVRDSGIDEESYRAEALESPKATAPLVDTPRIVTVVTGEVLEDTASFSFEDALRTVPGITLGAGEGGTANADIPFIRGIDATGSVFVDGARDIGAQSRETFAIESIEVAKGPSSAFGGRGTAGGAINLNTRVAREGNFGSVQATAGTSDLVRVVGDVNAEVSDWASVRVVGMYHDSDVAGRDSVFDDRWGVLPSITFGAGQDITASVSYYHYETDSLPDYGIPLTSRGQLPDDRREPADVDRDNFYGLLARDFQEDTTDAVTFDVSAYAGGGITVSNTTRYSRNSVDYVVTNPDDTAGNVTNGFVWRNTKSRGSTSEGLASNTNLAAVFDTGSIAHSLSAGFEFSTADSDNVTYTAPTGNYRFNPDPDKYSPGCLDPQGLAEGNCTTLDDPDPADNWIGEVTRSTGSPATSSAEEYSLYLFDTVTIVPQLLLNGGLRWTSFSAEAAGTQRDGTTFNASNSGDFWTWQAGAIFKPSETSSIYASYANSKTPPGTTVGEGSENLAGNNDFLKPQTFENYEIGAKAELLNGNLLLSGAVFQIDRGNITPLDDNLADDDEVIEAARLRGFEVSAAGQIGPVSLLVGYTYIDSELREDAPGTDDDPTNDADSNIGNRLPQTPEHNFSGTVTWQVTPQFAVGGGAYATSERFADSSNLIRADGYVRFDANAQYDFSENFAVRVNVQNLTDKRYIVQLRNPHFAVPAPGRQALVTLTARY